MCNPSLIDGFVVDCSFQPVFLDIPSFWQVLSQLLRKAKQRNFVLPNVNSQGAGAGEGFEGATVSLYFII